MTPRLFIAGEPLRGLAALAILAYHLAFFFPGDGGPGMPVDFAIGADVLSRAGQQLVVGLAVFFVLSGYLIGRPFVWALVRGRPLPAVGDYARRRLLRIAPAMWATVLATALVLGLDGTSAREVLAVLAFAQTLDPSPLAAKVGHLWTIDVEMAFYVAMPIAALALAAVLRGPPARRAALLAGVIGVLGGLSLAVHVTGPPEPGHDLLSRLYLFVPGLLLALVEPFAPRLRGAAWLAPLGVALVAIVVLAQPGRVAFAVLVMAAAGCLVAAPLLHQWSTGTAPRALDNAPLRWLGSRSYSLYLVHVPVIVALLPRLADNGASLSERLPAVAGCALASLALADLSFRAVERPFLRRRGSHHPAQDGAARTPPHSVAA